MVGVICLVFFVHAKQPPGKEIHCLFVCLFSGVSVMKGQEEVHIRAPIVISNAGIFNTYQKLLPKELQAMPGKK